MPLRTPRPPWAQWTLGVGAVGALALGATLVFPRVLVVPAPVSAGPFLTPWVTSVQSTSRHGHLAITFKMTNLRGTSLTVKPWKTPAQLQFTAAGSLTPVATFPLSWPSPLVIGPHDSRSLSTEIPDPPPGWYGLNTSTVGVKSPAQTTWLRTSLGGQIFSPYPTGSLRTGTISLQKTVRREGYTVTLERLSLTATHSVLTFEFSKVPVFPTTYTVQVAEGVRTVATWGSSQGNPQHVPFAKHVPLIGSVTFDPLRNSVKTLTVILSNLGTSEQPGKTTVTGPWTFHITLQRHP